MNKALISFVLMAASSQLLAESNVCDYSVDMNVNIEQERVLFSNEAGDSFEFIDDRLLINGVAAELSDDQQQASIGMQQQARALVPKIAKVAIEGAELGLKATTIVMTSLFGNDPQMQQDLVEPIEALMDKIKNNISETSFNSQAFESSIDEAFDEEFESLIENAVSKYSGQLVGNILATVFSGDNEEIADLEFRMENMEREIETYVEANAEAIEAEADALCVDMAKIDALDDRLIGVDGYPEQGLILKDADQGVRINPISVDTE